MVTIQGHIKTSKWHRTEVSPESSFLPMGDPDSSGACGKVPLYRNVLQLWEYSCTAEERYIIFFRLEATQ